MIKNRTAQLIYQTIYLTLGFVGLVASLGIFDNINTIRWDFYVHFTNISNFLCIGVMLAGLIQTAKKKEDSFVSAAPILKFIGMLGILLTFLVFNIMLAGAEGRDPQANWRIGSLCFHVVLPIMYIADWFLFYERKKAKPNISFTDGVITETPDNNENNEQEDKEPSSPQTGDNSYIVVWILLAVLSLSALVAFGIYRRKVTQ